jgi:hypothetical protein
MSTKRTVTDWLWKIPVSGAAYALGTMLGGTLVTAAGLELPKVPMEVDPGLQPLLLFAGGMAMALGLAAMAIGLSGRLLERWAVLTLFVFVVNGVGNALEGSIFTTLGGHSTAVLMKLPAFLLCALAVATLFPGPSGEGLVERLGSFRSRWTGGALAGRLGLAILAFPFFYFLFGMMVTPIVIPHYERLEYLVIPPMPTMLAVLFFRSALFLLVSFPVIAAWQESRVKLVLGLGLGHFAAVGFADLIQGVFLPAILRWTHGVEILADSLFYAWVLVWLLLPRGDEGPEDEAAARTTTDPAAVMK